MNMQNNTEQFGIHLMLDGYGANLDSLKNTDKLTAMLHDIPASMGMHIICEPTVVEVGPKNHKDPGGLSGFVMIAESHISFHTFPNRGFVTVDVYTCQNEMDIDKLVALLTNAFELKSSDVYVQKRGLNYPAQDIQ